MTESYKLPSALDIVADSYTGDPNHPLESAANTDWVRIFDTLDPFIADRETLEELKDTAPTSRAKDWLWGIIDTRKMYAAVTGNPF